MKVTVSRGIKYIHQHGDTGYDSRPHEHMGSIAFSIDRVGFAKPIDPQAFLDTVATTVTPLYGADLHEVPGLEPNPLALAFRLRELLLPAYPDVMVKLTENGLEVEVP
jgi:hypothetical protein